MEGYEERPRNKWKYDLFLCHTGVDKEWVRKLASDIEKEELHGRKLKVFFDEWDIQPGDNLVLRIEEGLKNSRFVGIILSEDMLGASWPTLEWTSALYQDPTGRSRRLLPMLLKTCEVPAVLSTFNRLNFRVPSSYKGELNRLLVVLREESLPRGDTMGGDGSTVSQSNLLFTGKSVGNRSWEADIQEEEVLTNLFPVGSMPQYVFVGDTWARQPFDIFEGSNGKPIPPFVLRDEQIYAFEDLGNARSILRSSASVTGTETFLTEDILGKESRRNIVLELLNRTVWKHCRTMDLAYDKVSKKYFSYSLNGEPRSYGWKPNKRWSDRKIARPYVFQGRTLFWVHLALQARFTSIGQEPYLKISPSWFHTTDGVEPVPVERRGPLSTRRVTRESNERVLSNLRLWVAYLGAGSGSISMQTGGMPLVIECRPLSYLISRGILGDYGKIKTMFEEAEEIDVDMVLQQGLEEATDDLGLEDEENDSEK